MRMWTLILSFLTAAILSGYVFASHFDGPGVCKDVYVWIADSSVECKYLENESSLGLHNAVEEYCMRDPNTRCCITCKRLGFVRGGVNNATAAPNPSPSTPVPITAMPTSTKRPTSSVSPSCQDIGIWTRRRRMVSCRYLERQSRYNFHENPLQHCRNTQTTLCCETCARLGV